MLLYHFGARVQLHGHSAAIQSSRKELRKKQNRESLSDIEIMTLRGAETAPGCCRVRWRGNKGPLQNRKNTRAQQNAGCAA